MRSTLTRVVSSTITIWIMIPAGRIILPIKNQVSLPGPWAIGVCWPDMVCFATGSSQWFWFILYKFLRAELSGRLHRLQQCVFCGFGWWRRQLRSECHGFLRDSPGIGYVDGAYRVGSDGDCVNSGSDGIMHDSYGISFIPRKFQVSLSVPRLQHQQLCVPCLPRWTRRLQHQYVWFLRAELSGRQ